MSQLSLTHRGFVVEGVLREEFLLNGSYVDDILMAYRLDTVDPDDLSRG